METFNDIIDIEAYTREGKQPPIARGYKVKINGEHFVFDDPVVTGREVLEKAGLSPPEGYTLRLKAAGERPKKVGLDDEVNLRHPGVEKFKALPCDQQEGQV